MGTLEWVAGIFALLAIVKLSLFFWKPKLIEGWAQSWLKNLKTLWLFALVAATFIGYIVLTSMTIIHVVAALFFAHLLLGLYFLSYPKIMEKVYKDILKVGIRKAWLPLTIYLILSFWTLYALFLQ